MWRIFVITFLLSCVTTFKIPNVSLLKNIIRTHTSLASAEDIHHLLDNINENDRINSFYSTVFKIKGKISSKQVSGVDLARKRNFDLRFINETAIMETNNLHVPYTGVDIELITNDITAASEIDPKAPRRKFLLATLRGVGGGKTRMIEECRIRLGLLYPNWIPIAITFNHETEVSDSDFAWENADLIIAFAVCSRILSSVYTIPIKEARRRINLVLKSVSEKYHDNEDSLENDLVVGTMAHVAARVRQVKPSIDSFVLFIDESMKLIEYNNKFPQGFSDPYSTLRKTILGEEMGKILKSSLVMTALNVSAFGITDSGRDTVAVVLASKLSVEHIVTKIWIPSFSSSSKKTSKQDKAILELLAASVNSAPRLVEVMGRALRKEFENSWPVSWRGQSLTQSLGAVLQEYELLKKRSYRSVPFPVGKYLHALINSAPIVIDQKILKYMRSSTFTNSISTFAELDKDVFIVPESALSLLVGNNIIGGLNEFEKEIKSEFDQIWNDLKQHIQSPSPSIKGQPLEDAFQRVLHIRILSMHLKDDDKGQTTLHDLLAVDIEAVMFPIEGRPYSVAKVTKGLKTVEQDGASRNVTEWMSNTFEPSRASGKKKARLKQLLNRVILVPDCIIESIGSSVTDKALWKADIKECDFNVQIAKPQPNNDHCDLMMFTKMQPSSAVAAASSGEEEIVVVFEEKSKTESNAKNEVWLGHFAQDDKTPYHQYFKFCNAVSTITEEDLVGDNGYLKALRDGRFLYVYVTTHPGPTVYLTPEDLSGISAATKSQGVLVLNREVTKEMLGIVFEVYALARSAL